MNKKQLRQAMIEVINSFNDDSRDEWYGTDREYAKFGIESLAEHLNIKLDLYNELAPSPEQLTVAQLKLAARYDRPITYTLKHHDPCQEDIKYVGVINDTQDNGYYGLSREEIFELDMDFEALCVFDLDCGIETYSKVEGVKY